ncbi:D-alanyl-D-alanine carboxypeptidase/D-alanyl-D-alanine-endopeptidase [Thiolapillus sp.]
MFSIRLVLSVLLFSFVGDRVVAAALDDLEIMPSASLLFQDQEHRLLISYKADTPRIPASTLKILTAWLAIRQWGLEHRFHTDFFMDEQQALWIKGYGDPMLISEEIERIAQALYAKGLRSVRGIRADSGYFQNQLDIDGRSGSDNPYDAPVAALAANFNTLFLNKTNSGLQSAEPQTPLTSTARKVARGMKNGRQRINIGNAQLAARYFAELLRDKLRQQDVDVEGEIRLETVPDNLPVYYRHYNSHTLEDVLRAMLRYSTNFIANQIFLLLGVEEHAPPANFRQAQNHVRQQVAKDFHWDHFVIREGAGLSRTNRINARQMIELLNAFYPYRRLLPKTQPGVLAKTGTLKGISCYAGYVNDLPFALFINQPAPYQLRKQIVTAMSKLATQSAPVR